MRDFRLRRFFKVYSIVFALLVVIGYIGAALEDPAEFFIILDIADIPITLTLVVGFLGFGWNRRLLAQRFWQVFFIVSLAWVIWYVGFYWPPDDVREIEGPIWLFVTFVYLIHLPVFIGLYKYAFEDKHPWSESSPVSLDRVVIDKSIEITEGNYRDFIDFNEVKYIAKFGKFVKAGGRYELTWHWPAFFFGPLWFAYRRMYGWAILAAIAQAIPIFGWLAIGFTANYIYFTRVNKDIRWIRSQEDDELEISQRLSRAGESSTSAVLVVVLIFVLIAVIPAEF